MCDDNGRAMNSLRRKITMRSKLEKQVRFDLEVRDLSLDIDPGKWSSFQPHMIVVRVSRRRTAAETSQVKWEASLKSPFNGFCFWEPPVNTGMKRLLAILRYY